MDRYPTWEEKQSRRHYIHEFWNENGNENAKKRSLVYKIECEFDEL